MAVKKTACNNATACSDSIYISGRLRLVCDGTHAGTTFHLSAKLTSPYKLARASVLSTTGIRGVRINLSNAESTLFRGSVKNTGYQLHRPFSLLYRCLSLSGVL